MLQYVIAGLALGSIYAIASSSLVVTFVSSGVLNFSFGAVAYLVARFYYFLNSQHGWRTDEAGAVSLLLFAPALGILLYAFLFRHLRGKSTLVKLVATIGMFVTIPAVATIFFGTQTITSAPGLASPRDAGHPFHVFGSPVTTDQVIIYGFLVFILVAGTAVLRFTDIGLKVRAMVDSEAMTSISGTNPGRVSLGVWAVTTAVAGLAGILVAPSQGLDPIDMTKFMAVCFAPVIVARLRSLPVAVVVSLVMGVVTDVIQKYLPANSSLTADIVPSVPFGFILVFLVVSVLRSGTLNEGSDAGGPLDQAIKPAQEDPAGTADQLLQRGWDAYIGVIPIAIIAALPLIFHGSAYWLNQTALGVCLAITFLTFTVVTGEGGMLWLTQIVFAGVGGLGAGQFATVYHLPVLLGIVLSAVIAAAVGALVGLLTIRFGELYVALVTLTFGVLVGTLVFDRDRFLKGGPGVALNRPAFATSDFKFAYLAVAVFLVLALLTLNLRRSSTGLALRAVRDSEAAARTLGLSVVQVRVMTGALAAFVAAVGGGFYALWFQQAQPQNYDAFAGLIWLAVVVTLGVRSITGAAASAMLYALANAWFTNQNWIPTRWDTVPQILFGLGALSVAMHPEGSVVQMSRLIRQHLIGRHGTAAPGPANPGARSAGIGVAHPGVVK